MAGKVRHLLSRSGRYYARLVVPKDLRGVIGKTEFQAPLGADYRQAVRKLPHAVAEFQDRLAQAERQIATADPAKSGKPLRFPLTRDQIAKLHYTNQEDFDAELRLDPRYASIGFVDEYYVQRLREGAGGRLYNDELHQLIGVQVERYRRMGHHDLERGSDEWRRLAMMLCLSELEALSRTAERNEGIFDGQIKASFAEAKLPHELPEPVSIMGLWDSYCAARKSAGYMKDGGQRQRPVFERLVKYLKHDDARRVTKADLIQWRDHLLKTKTARTVRDVELASVRSVFKWAHANDHIEENVAQHVTQPKPRKQVLSREKGYRTEEAEKIIKAARSYQPHADSKGRVREKPRLIDAKRWVPLLCAFTGARVSEITQLRKEDVRDVKGVLVARITPDAGTVKAGGYRDVPLHPQIIEEGFKDFLDNAADGPLFHAAQKTEDYKRKSLQATQQLGNWIRESGLRVEGVAPNHGWRHRFKTLGMELGIDSRVVDAIQGHAGRTAGENYGDVTLKARVAAIEKLPRYDFS